jgi:hypothetical protein
MLNNICNRNDDNIDYLLSLAVCQALTKNFMSQSIKKLS